MALSDLNGRPASGPGLAGLTGRVLVGRYRLLAPVGTGASAHVFMADDVQLRRRVAVKVLHPGLAADPSFLRRFQAEAQAAAALNHPNVLAVYDWGRDEGQGGAQWESVPFLVTELLTGGTLRAILDHGGKSLSLSQTLMVGLEACRGLHYAHTRGFVHRDVKPANLLYGDDRRLRIADFGLTRALAEASWTEPEGVVLGTARYVSPEQAAGSALDARSDVYSLALVLTECVTGRVPHAVDTAIGTLQARKGCAITVDEATFGPLAAVLESAGRIDPAERSSAAQLGQGLVQAAEQLPAPEPLPLVELQVAGALPEPGAATHLFGARPPARTGTGTAPARQPAVVVPVVPGVEGRPGGVDGEGSESVAASRSERRRQSGRRGRWLRAALALLVAAALVVVAVLIVPVLVPSPPGSPSAATFPVDSYVGLDLDTVQDRLAVEGRAWEVLVDTDRRDGSRVGEILRQNPGPDTELVEGGRLELTRSLGDRQVVVPPLVGNMIDDPVVTDLFARAQLKIDRRPADDETKPVGEILAIEAVGTYVDKGSTIAVTVSSGPAPRVLVDFADQDSTTVLATLATAGLVGEATTETSESVEEGLVIRTEPGRGQSVPKGGTVAVVVSSGPPRLTVPAPAGRTGRAMEDLLQAAGWRITETVGPTTGIVIGTDPAEGEVRVKGSPIRIFTGQN